MVYPVHNRRVAAADYQLQQKRIPRDLFCYVVYKKVLGLANAFSSCLVLFYHCCLERYKTEFYYLLLPSNRATCELGISAYKSLEEKGELEEELGLLFEFSTNFSFSC